MTGEIKAQLKQISVQSQDGKSEEIVQSYECTMKCLGEKGWLIKYEDGENGGSSVTLRIGERRAEIVRSGKLSGLRMRIEPDKENISYVKTPYGEFTVAVRGISVECSLDENGGTAAFSYFNGSEMSLKLEVETI